MLTHGSLITLQSKATGHYVTSHHGNVTAMGAAGASSTWRVHAKGAAFMLENLAHPGQYLRFTQGNSVDGHGVGHSYCDLHVSQHHTGAYLFSSAFVAGARLAFGPHGNVKPPSTVGQGPFAQFFVTVVQHAPAVHHPVAAHHHHAATTKTVNIQRGPHGVTVTKTTHHHPQPTPVYAAPAPVAAYPQMHHNVHNGPVVAVSGHAPVANVVNSAGWSGMPNRMGDGKVIHLQSKLSGKNLRLFNGTIDGNGGAGQYAKFVVERLPGSLRCKLRSVAHPGKYLALDAHGSIREGVGHHHCEFNIVKHGHGVISLMSAHNGASYIACGPAGRVFRDTSTVPRSQFTVINTH